MVKVTERHRENLANYVKPRGVLIVGDHYSDSANILDASTPEALGKAAIWVLRRRINDGYIQNPGNEPEVIGDEELETIESPALYREAERLQQRQMTRHRAWKERELLWRWANWALTQNSGEIAWWVLTQRAKDGHPESEYFEIVQMTDPETETP